MQKIAGRYWICDCPSAKQLAYEIEELRRTNDRRGCACATPDCQHKPSVEKLQKLYNGEPLYRAKKTSEKTRIVTEHEMDTFMGRNGVVQ